MVRRRRKVKRTDDKATVNFKSSKIKVKSDRYKTYSEVMRA